MRSTSLVDRPGHPLLGIGWVFEGVVDDYCGSGLGGPSKVGKWVAGPKVMTWGHDGLHKCPEALFDPFPPIYR